MIEKTFKLSDRLDPSAEEAYKTLRTNIQFCEVDSKIKTLTIASCIPGEGKTTTAINLGISFAKAGKRVLFVDADLRKPMLMKQLESKNFKGLSNFVSGRASMDEIINVTSVPGFHFVACGVKPPNPAELIGSAKFSEFLEKVRDRYDVVIIDTPPLGSVIDCAIIAAQTDGSLIVVQPKAVKYQEAQRVKEQLEKAGARILGVVLNKVTGKHHKNRYRYYDFYGNDRTLNRDWYKNRYSKKVEYND